MLILSHESFLTDDAVPLEMRMANPIPQFTHLISTVASRHPSMAYIHLIESRVCNWTDLGEKPEESLDFAREVWRPTGQPFLVAGGFNPENALSRMAEEGMENVAIVFGRHFVSNVSRFVSYTVRPAKRMHFIM